MHKKIKFFLTISCYPFRQVFSLFGINLNIIEAINDYYRERFRALPYSSRAIFLPHCLRSQDCPARFSSDTGIICLKCGRCNCGKIKEISEKKGYKFYIVPDTGFIKRIILKYQIHGAIGVACDYDIKKGIKEEKVTRRGVGVSNTKLIPQGVRLPQRNCEKNTVDWALLEKTIMES